MADTLAVVRTLKTSYPRSYYITAADIVMTALRRSTLRSFCEWKGDAVYYDLEIDGERLADVAWSYPDPTRRSR